MLGYFTALSGFCPLLQPPPASTAAPAGDCRAGDWHLSGERWDQQPQVSKSVFGKYTQMLHKLFWPTQESALFTPWRIGICKKWGNINYANVSSWHKRRRADFADEMSVSAGGSGSVGWVKHSCPFTPPHCPVSASHQGLPTAVPGLCLRPQSASPMAGPWVTHCAAALTGWHHFISAWHNKTGLGDSFIMPQIDINRCSKQM